MTGGPSTGSCMPIAMNVLPFHCSRKNCADLSDASTPSMSGVTGTSAGNLRTPAR